MSEPAPAIEAAELGRTYGKGTKAVHALAEVTFAVSPGIVFALLGPNGAGKSTAVRILTTLSRPDRGRATVHGIDVGRHPDRVRQLIGCVSQKPGFDPVATGLENLVLQGRIHGASARAARLRAAELLDRFHLTTAAHRLTGAWSGGMQRKLDVAMGLMHRPRVLFLDEPTTGLGPQARQDRRVARGIAAPGSHRTERDNLPSFRSSHPSVRNRSSRTSVRTGWALAERGPSTTA